MTMRNIDLARLESKPKPPRPKLSGKDMGAVLESYRKLCTAQEYLAAATLANLYGLEDEMKKAAGYLYQDHMNRAWRTKDIREYHDALQIARRFSLGISAIIAAEKGIRSQPDGPENMASELISRALGSSD